MILIPIRLFGQDCIISIDNQNELFLVHNYFDIHVKGVGNDSLLLTTDNGVIEKANGRYRITPEKFPYAMIFVYQILNNDTVLITQKRFKVRTFEGYTHANIAGKSRGLIKKQILLALGQVSSEVNNAGFDLRLPIISYRLFVLRNDKVLFTRQNNSNKFTEETIKGLELTQSGDVIYIVDIKATNPGDLTINLNDIILTIE